MKLPTIDSLPFYPVFKGAKTNQKGQPITWSHAMGLPEVYTPLRGAPRNDREFENSHPITAGCSDRSNSFIGRFCGARRREMAKTKKSPPLPLFFALDQNHHHVLTCESGAAVFQQQIAAKGQDQHLIIAGLSSKERRQQFHQFRGGEF